MKRDIIQKGIIQVIGDYLYPIFVLRTISAQIKQGIKIINLYSNYYSDAIMDDVFTILYRIYPKQSINFESSMPYYSKNFKDWLVTKSGLKYYDSLGYSGQNEIIDGFSTIINDQLELEFGYMMNKYFKTNSYNVECIPLYNLDHGYLLKYVLLIAYNKYDFHFIFSRNNKNIVSNSSIINNVELVLTNSLKEKTINNCDDLLFDNVSIAFERRDRHIMIHFFGNDTVNQIKHVILKILIVAPSMDVAEQIENLLIYVNKIKPFKENQCVINNKDLNRKFSSMSFIFNEEFGSW